MKRSPAVLAVLALAGTAAAQVVVGPVVNPANGNRYYRLAPAVLNSHTATAASLGGTLATINDAAENAWVRANVAAAGGNTVQCYIGLNDLTTEGTYVWRNGDPLFYTNWSAGEPNNQFNEDAVAMIVPNGLWNDIPTNLSGPAIVEVTGPIRVPAEFPTIQDAITAAVNGQTILVAPGNYVDAINFGSKDLRIIAEGGPEVTTIATFNSGDGIVMVGTSPDACFLEGFTIVPAFDTLWSVVVVGNAAVRGCRIGGYTNYGVYAQGNATVSDCLFVGGFGGVLGFGLSNSVDVTVQNCTIVGSTIAAIVTQTEPLFSANVRVTNSIVTGNAQPALVFARSAVNFSNSHVQGGAPGLNNSAADPRLVNAPGEDNFFSLGDNYALAPDSPCIDSGNNAARVATLSAFPLDAAGNSRFADFAAAPNTGSGPGAIVDRGAIETQAPSCPVDFNADGFLDFFDYDAFVEAFEFGC